MKSLLTCLLLMASALVAGQSVGIGTQSPNSSAMLDVSSTSKGLLIPRMTEAQKSQIASPATGLLIWQTDGTPGFYYNGGTPEGPKWYMLTTEAENFWRLNGNSGTNMANQFLGTTDAQGLRFKVRNTWAGQVDSGMATHLGYKAGWQAPHYSNTAFGTEALSAPSDEMGNTAFGFWAAKDTRSGNNNTAMGQYSLGKNISGSRNTAQGSASLFNNVSGSRNTAIGHWALYISDTANDNTAIGSQALWINKASNNTAVGSQAMVSNTTGSMNTAVGWSAGSIITTGNGNTYLGYEANANVGTRINATAIGARAYADCNNCLILGSVSGVNNASSSVRVGIGTNNPSALLTLNSKIGSSNINFEVDDTVRGSLYATNGSFMDMVLATAFDNQTGRIRLNAGGTQFKISPLGTVTIGPSGMVGPYTLLVSDSDKDPMIQFQKGATDKGFVQIVNDDIKIGTNNSNDLGSFFIRTNGADRVKVDPSGNVGIGTSSPTVKFQVGANGDGTVARANSWTTFSDERYKTQIVSIDHALDKLDQIGGYYYQWKEGADQSRQAGLIAQEVEKVLPEIVQTDEAGYKSVDYGKMNALLIQAIKEQQKEIEELKAILKTKKRK